MQTPLPHGLSLDESFGVLKISRRWFSPSYFVTLGFSLFWIGIMVVWYTLLRDPVAPEPGFPFVASFLLPLGHVALGLGLAYASIAGLLNKTTFVVGQGNLRVTHHPIPCPGNRVIPEASIKQLYVSEREQSRKTETWSVFSVHAQLTGGKKVKLATNLLDKQQALFLENRIEKYLRIRDEAVLGEVKKD